MFFNTKKKMAKELLNKQARELADAILNIFKTGLFKTKYHKTVGDFTLPPNIFKDIYISGFIEHFISLNLSYIYNKDNRWTHDEIGDFVVNGYKNLNFTTEDIQLYTNLIIDENIRKDWNIDGRYTLGKEHARLCFCCMFNIFADNENSKLLPKAKEIAKNMPNILGDETYEIKLISAICELTIYDYLRKQFGGVLIGKHDFASEDKEEKISKIESAKDIYDLPPKYDEEYRKIMKEFEVEKSPKHAAALYGILFGVGSMMLISATLILNRIDNEFQAVIGGLLVGGIAYFAQYQNEKNYSIKYTEKMIKVEEELVNKAKFEHRHKQKG